MIDSIGGQFWLFIGMRLLTFLELTELGTLILMAALRLKKRPKAEQVATDNAIHSFESHDKKQDDTNKTDRSTISTDCIKDEI